MFAPKYIGVLAVLSALASVDATGICYSPWHHGTVDEEVVQKDFEQMKQYFDSVRTYHAKFGGPYGGVNVIDAAAKAGSKVSVGIMMGDGEEDEIQNVCDGAQRHPEAVDSIMVGNENLQNGGWGSCSTQKLIETIEKVKACVAGKGIKVGTSQRINEWLTADGRKELAEHCDIVGVNIYPFFTPGHDEPIEKFKKQWEQVNQEIPGGKVVVTETGWPRQGESEGDNVPSQQTTQKYFNDFNQWCKEQGKPNYFFMMYDTTQSYTGKQYEKSFGVADSNGILQIQIPEQGGGGYEQQTEPPAQDGGEQQQEPPAQDGGEQQTEPPAQDGGEQQTEPPAQGGGEQQQEPPAQDGGDYGQVQPPADQTPVEEQTADQAPVEPVPEQQTPEQQTPEQTPVVTPAPVHDNDKLCV